jgi:hypothetical protein
MIIKSYTVTGIKFIFTHYFKREEIKDQDLYFEVVAKDKERKEKYISKSFKVELKR